MLKYEIILYTIFLINLNIYEYIFNSNKIKGDFFMEYTKDVIFNIQYGEGVQAIKLKDRKFIKQLIKIYNNNKFIVIILALTTLLIMLDLWMVSNFIDLLVIL